MSLLRGLQWVPGVEILEVQDASGLTIDTKNLTFSCTAKLSVASKDTWRAIHNLLGLRKHENERTYLGAPHPQFVDVIDGERIPMLWVDSLTATPAGDYYADSNNPQILHWNTTHLDVTYSNDSLHYSRIKCRWIPKLEQEYIQVGTLFWKDESKTGNAQYNTDADFMALPTQKYSRRVMTADIQYSVAFYMNPTFPGCLPEWCDMATPIPEELLEHWNDDEATKLEKAKKRAAELKKLLGAVNKNEIELFPYFGDKVAKDIFSANINDFGTFIETDDKDRSLAAPPGTLLFADVSCDTEFRPWIFGNPSASNITEGIGLRQMPITLINFRIAYRRNGWNNFWNGMRMEYGKLWWQDVRNSETEEPERKDVVLFEERDFTAIQKFIRDNISWNE